MPRIEKGWGYEEVFHNSPLYCGKLLVFHRGGKGSAHYHLKKTETWFIFTGSFILRTIDPKTAKQLETKLNQGESVHIPVGTVHQLEALEDSVIFEVSTQDFTDDSYRVFPGDSQILTNKNIQNNDTN